MGTLFSLIHLKATTNHVISTGAHPDLNFSAPVTAAFPASSSPRVFLIP
jgi:hypothetical protein